MSECFYLCQLFIAVLFNLYNYSEVRTSKSLLIDIFTEGEFLFYAKWPDKNCYPAFDWFKSGCLQFWQKRVFKIKGQV